jgi:hypothetical protein
MTLLFAALHESGCGRYCCKSRFAVAGEQNCATLESEKIGF